MITTSTPGAPPSTPGGTQPDGPNAGRVLAGFAAAITLQIGAALAAMFSLFIVVAAVFANFGNYGPEQESTWWVIFAVPMATLALAIYVLSGFTASRVMRTGLGWLTLLATPAMIVFGAATGQIG